MPLLLSDACPLMQAQDDAGTVLSLRMQMGQLERAVRRPGLMARAEDVLPDAIGRVCMALASDNEIQGTDYRCHVTHTVCASANAAMPYVDIQRPCCWAAPCGGTARIPLGCDSGNWFGTRMQRHSRCHRGEVAPIKGGLQPL